MKPKLTKVTREVMTMKKISKANKVSEAKKAKKQTIKLSDLEPKKDPKGGPIVHPGGPQQSN